MVQTAENIFIFVLQFYPHLRRLQSEIVKVKTVNYLAMLISVKRFSPIYIGNVEESRR